MWTRRLCLRIGITTLPPAVFVGHDIPTHTVLFRSGRRVPHHHRVVPSAAERGAGSSAAVPLHRALLSLLGRGALLLPAEIHHLAGTVQTEIHQLTGTVQAEIHHLTDTVTHRNLAGTVSTEIHHLAGMGTHYTAMAVHKAAAWWRRREVLLICVWVGCVVGINKQTSLFIRWFYGF